MFVGVSVARRTLLNPAWFNHPSVVFTDLITQCQTDVLRVEELEKEN